MRSFASVAGPVYRTSIDRMIAPSCARTENAPGNARNVASEIKNARPQVSPGNSLITSMRIPRTKNRRGQAPIRRRSNDGQGRNFLRCEGGGRLDTARHFL